MPAKKKIDPDEVRKLVMIGATIKEIARYVGCGHTTIERRFMEEVEAGRAKGRIYFLSDVCFESHWRRWPLIKA